MAEDSSNTLGTGMMLGILIVMALVVFLFMSARSGVNTNTTSPNSGGTNNGGGTKIEVPEQIDVNVNQGQEGQ